VLEAIKAVAREAGDLILSAENREKDVTEKSFAFDLVTDYDKAVQKLVEQRLHTVLPEASFLGEEDVAAPYGSGEEYCFVIDPIDGTTNFIKNLHMSCVSIGLAKGGKMEYGVVYNPYTKELFCAQRGKGAFLNDKPLQISERKTTKPVSIMGMSPYYRERFQKDTFSLMQTLFSCSVDVRVTGSAALDFCFVAAGRAEMFAEFCMSPWDCAAGSLIAQEAGCLVSDMAGKPLQFEEKTSVLVAHPAMYPSLLAAARPYVQNKEKETI
jgi:myo-inositol-1(or 4)-monophosphatase